MARRKLLDWRSRRLWLKPPCIACSSVRPTFVQAGVLIVSELRVVHLREGHMHPCMGGGAGSATEEAMLSHHFYQCVKSMSTPALAG